MRSLKHFAKIIICTLSLFSAFAFAQDRYGVLAYHSIVDESAAENQKQYFPCLLYTSSWHDFRC